MKNTTPLSFGEKIKQIRIAKGLRQEELAKAINTAQNFVSRLESGEAKYDDRMLEIIREFYGIENAPIFDHELETYRNRLWVCNDLVNANNLHDAKVTLDTLSPILELPFERDLTLLYFMVEARVLFKEKNLAAVEERLNTAEALLDGASTEALHLYHRNMGVVLLIKREFKASLKHFLQSLDNETNNVKPDVGILHNIGVIYLSLSKPWHAVLYFEKAKIKYNLGSANILESIINSHLAASYMFVGAYDKAEHIFNGALVQAKSINNDFLTRLILSFLAALHMRKGNMEESLEACNQTLMLFRNGSTDDVRTNRTPGLIGMKDFLQCDVLINKALCLIGMKDFVQCNEVIKQGKELAKDNYQRTIIFEALSHILTLDNSESTDYLENFAIPYLRTGDDVEKGKHHALEFCNMLEAHYRKKRNKKRANDIAVIGRDIHKEIYFGEVEF